MTIEDAKKVLPSRFADKISVTQCGEWLCWLWTACKDKDGYGSYQLNTHKKAKPHRYAYEMLVRKLGRLHAHHRCPNKHCCNPDHIQPITNSRHSKISGVAAINTAKTHCKYGHPFDKANTHYDWDGHRGCRICRRRLVAESKIRVRNRPPRAAIHSRMAAE